MDIHMKFFMSTIANFFMKFRHGIRAFDILDLSFEHISGSLFIVSLAFYSFPCLISIVVYLFFFFLFNKRYYSYFPSFDLYVIVCCVSLFTLGWPSDQVIGNGDDGI